MAKRFTDSTKWNDNWFSNLSDKEKLTWIYILDTCDHAGIWEKNLRVLNFHIGSTYVEGDLNKIFSGKFVEIRDKWFIPNFIKFQYGNKFLTSNTPAVVSARELLLEIGFIQQDGKGILTLKQGLDKGYVTLKDKEEDKDIDKDKLKDKLKDELKEIFKDIPDVIKLIDRNDLDILERKQKHLFNIHYSTIVEYQSIKI
jgi:hypothetical protein